MKEKNNITAVVSLMIKLLKSAVFTWERGLAEISRQRIGN